MPKSSTWLHAKAPWSRLAKLIGIGSVAKLINYFFTGLICSIVDFGLFAILVKVAHWPWFLAGFLSFTLSIAVGYAISIRIVFTSGVRFKRSNEITLVFIISTVGLAFNQVFLYVLIHNGFDALTAKLWASIFVITWNFLARSQFVFKARKSFG